MRITARVGVIALMGGFAASLLAGPATAGSDDVNAVFAPMEELSRSALDAASGMGASDIEQNATLIVNGVTPTPEEAAALNDAAQANGGHFTGTNDIAANAAAMPNVVLGTCPRAATRSCRSSGMCANVASALARASPGARHPRTGLSRSCSKAGAPAP